MKTTFFCILIFTFSSCSLLSSAQTTPAAVLDTAGRELRRDASYYILPAESGNGGGITLLSQRGTRCPFIITKSPDQGNNGIPLKFLSINPEDSVIRLSTDLNIKFTTTPSTCPESTVWKLEADQSGSTQRFVTVGGVEGNPRPETVSSWFKIEKSEDGVGYQIRFCPSSRFCKPGTLCKFLCGNIGTVNTVPLRRLGFVNQESFKVKFMRAA